MSTTKTYTVAGVATSDGTTKVRFANDLDERIKVLEANNCTDIQLEVLPQAMTKLEALRYLSRKEGYSSQAQSVIIATLESKTQEARRNAYKSAFYGRSTEDA